MTADTVPRLGNLPAEPNSFVGRERDLGDLALLLANVRALTLCGPGGIGKTRLATRLGWQLAGEFPDGVWLVELADTADPALAARRVANVLGIGQEPDRPASATLVDALRGRRPLLILDTCEHIVDAIAELVHELIAGCPQLRLLATSREPLRVRGETVWRVPPLSLPGPALPAGRAEATDAEAAAAEAAAHEAVRLFVDRAVAVRPGFALSAANYAQISGLCRTLDGVPLAIELAAARVRALSVEQLTARIDDRFRLLASGDRTAPPRQQTLQATVDWSFGLLTEDEQILLRRLSVFAGWSLDMAERVCADERIAAGQVLELLAALIDKSLVTLEDEVGGDARYRLLDTIRDYASAQLAAAGEQQACRQRHSECMLAIAEDVVGQAFVRGLQWADQVTLYFRMTADQANLRAALGYCLDTADAEQGLRLCSAMRSPWVVQGDVTEGLNWFTRFLSLDVRVPAGVRARALMLSAELAFEQQDYPQAYHRAATAVSMCTAYRAACPAGGLRILALVSLLAGRVAEALEQADAAVAAARRYADEWEEGLARTARATILVQCGDPDGAQRSFDAALELLTGNNGWGVANTMYGVGSLARSRRDFPAARAHFSSALEIFRAIGAHSEVARCLAGIGWVLMESGDLAGAAASLAESLELSTATGQRLAIARGIEAFAALAVARADYPTALRLEGAASAQRAAAGPPRSASAQARLDAVLAPARQQLGRGASAGLRAEGGLLGMHEAVRLALSSARGPDPAAEPGRDPAPGPNRAAEPVPGSLLTAREQQIALLIARGLANRAIGAELGISPATVARHVANILAKLGLSSRAQVAAWTAGQPAAGPPGPGRVH